MNTPTFSPLFATRPASTPAVHDLAGFNAAPAEQLTTLLTFMTACRELARTIVVGRPYLRSEDIYSSAARSLHTLPTPLVKGIVDVHRPIDRVPLIEDAASSGKLSETQIGELREAALGYAAVQGHLFIADPALWGSAEAVAMIPAKEGATPPDVTEVYDHLLADVEARTILPPAKAWELTVGHLEESNRLKLVTLLGEDR
ncbi:hypothetical protein [Corynebacterium terpenotabidum]|uniref:Uncharacterized protein n=1 Tax=Corynebacterium terpenotabidum Y-11 TaxID=1200352 RepID=S4XME7_9CORY|nr:hypothetical protein [Corynebacterium terpenotabidum]AGP31813.1 hypothetical protein A606_10870 [Corynebacterium terpenotabidum Y-11]